MTPENISVTQSWKKNLWQITAIGLICTTCTSITGFAGLILSNCKESPAGRSTCPTSITSELIDGTIEFEIKYGGGGSFDTNLNYYPQLACTKSPLSTDGAIILDCAPVGD